MSVSLQVFLVVAAVVCWVLAALGVPSSRFNLIAAGLAFCGIAYLL